VRTSNYQLGNFLLEGGAALNSSSHWLLVSRSETTTMKSVYFEPNKLKQPTLIKEIVFHELEAFSIPKKVKGFVIEEKNFRFALGLEKLGNYSFGTNFDNLTWIIADMGLNTVPCIPFDDYNYEDHKIDTTVSLSSPELSPVTITTLSNEPTNRTSLFES